jgi:single-stranded DNA-binding protein
MNRQFAEGNLVAAAAVFNGKNERDVLSFTIACNEGKDSNGKDIVEYISVSAYGKKGFASKLVDYLGKGALVSAMGRLVMSKSEKDGVVYTNPRVEVSGLRNIRLLGSKPATTGAEASGHEATPAAVAQQAAASAASAAAALPAPASDSFDDDIPF